VTFRRVSRVQAALATKHLHAVSLVSPMARAGLRKPARGSLRNVRFSPKSRRERAVRQGSTLLMMRGARARLAIEVEWQRCGVDAIRRA
jgi:hypothetical protein